MSAIRTYFRLGFKLSGNVNKHKVSHGASTYHERFRTYISIGRGHGLEQTVALLSVVNWQAGRQLTRSL